MGAESILYHARMRVLQSRKGSRRPNALPRLHARQPVLKEKLVPPKEVLPRDRSFRYAYLQNHLPSGIKRMHSLNRPPDPARDEIVERIRAVERSKKEQEARKKAAEKKAAEAAAAATTAALKKGNSTTRLPRTSGIAMNSPKSITTLPPVTGSAIPIDSRWPSDDTSSSEEEEGGSFAFLAEWSSSPSQSPSVAKRQQLPALR